MHDILFVAPQEDREHMSLLNEKLGEIIEKVQQKRSEIGWSSPGAEKDKQLAILDFTLEIWLALLENNEVRQRDIDEARKVLESKIKISDQISKGLDKIVKQIEAYSKSENKEKLKASLTINSPRDKNVEGDVKPPGDNGE